MACAKSAVEMPGGGRRWKTLVSQLGEFRLDAEFPTVAHRPWKSPTARFPHSHRAGVDRIVFPTQTTRPRGARLSDLRSMGSQAAPGAMTPGASRQKGESLIPGSLD